MYTFATRKENQYMTTRLKSYLMGAAVFAAVIFTGSIDGRRVPAPMALAAAPYQGNGPGSQTCSTHTLNGSYGIRFEGSKLGLGLYVSVSRVTFDGQGQFTVSEIGRSNGSLVERTFTGPYVVNSDCTGYLDYSSNLTNPPHQAHGNFVIVNQGQEFYIIDNEDGWEASGVGKRI
jgi:hypothetical protein